MKQKNSVFAPTLKNKIVDANKKKVRQSLYFLRFYGFSTFKVPKTTFRRRKECLLGVSGGFILKAPPYFSGFQKLPPWKMRVPPLVLKAPLLFQNLLNNAGSATSFRAQQYKDFALFEKVEV